MTAIRKEVKVPWEDGAVTCRPSFAFIDRVEQRISISVLARQMRSGQSRLSDVIWVIYSALSLGPLPSVSYGEVGEEMLLQDAQSVPQVASDLIEAALSPTRRRESEDNGGTEGNAPKT